MVFFGFAINYMIRVNINIAIVEMARRPRHSINAARQAACVVANANATKIESVLTTPSLETNLQVGTLSLITESNSQGTRKVGRVWSKFRHNLKNRDSRA